MKIVDFDNNDGNKIVESFSLKTRQNKQKQSKTNLLTVYEMLRGKTNSS